MAEQKHNIFRDLWENHEKTVAEQEHKIFRDLVKEKMEETVDRKTAVKEDDEEIGI